MAARSTFTRTSGSVITSAWANSLRDHVVPYQAANDVTVEGMLSVHTGNDQLVVHDGTAARAIASYGAWPVAWAPTVTQTFTLSYTGTDMVVKREGREVTVDSALAFTTSGATGVAISIVSGLPNPSATKQVGTFTFVDSGTTVYTGTVIMTNTGTMSLQVSGNASALGATPSFAVVSGDVLYLNLNYYAASAA